MFKQLGAQLKERRKDAALYWRNARRALLRAKIDRIGLVGEISKILSRINGNIITHTANVSSDGTTAMSHFIADVDLSKEYDNDTLSRRLKRIKNVRQVKIFDI